MVKINKSLAVLTMGLILVACVSGYFLYDSENEQEEVEDMEDLYYGPVPQGYNVEHFRKTGETIKEVEN